MLELLPYERIKCAQSHHRDKQRDQERSNHVVAQEISHCVESSDGLDLVMNRGGKGIILKNKARVIDLFHIILLHSDCSEFEESWNIDPEAEDHDQNQSRFNWKRGVNMKRSNTQIPLHSQCNGRVDRSDHCDLHKWEYPRQHEGLVVVTKTWKHIREGRERGRRDEV